MLKKVLSSKKLHPAVIVSTKTSHEEKYNPGEDHFLVSTWHSHIQDLQKYNVSVPASSSIVSAIRSSGVFAVNFLSSEEFNKLVPDLTSGSTQINHFNLQIFENQKIKSPIVNNSLASIECELEKELLVGNNVLFTGKIVNSSFNNFNF